MIAEQVKFKPGLTMEPGLGPRVPAALAPTQSVFQPRTSLVKANGDAVYGISPRRTWDSAHACLCLCKIVFDRTEYGGMQGIVMHLQFPRWIIACQAPRAGE
jgi:hypothetical protein